MQTNPIYRTTLPVGPPTCLPGWATVRQPSGDGPLPGSFLLPRRQSLPGNVQDTFLTMWRPKGKAGSTPALRAWFPGLLLALKACEEDSGAARPLPSFPHFFLWTSRQFPPTELIIPQFVPT